LRRFKALAEVDYKVLGTELTGAPDHPYRLEQGQAVHYPLKVFVKPHWFPHLHTIDWTDFKLWTWIGGAKAIGGSISEDTETWYNYFSLYQTRLEAREVLGYFKAENSKQFTPDIELDLYSILPGQEILVHHLSPLLNHWIFNQQENQVKLMKVKIRFRKNKGIYHPLKV